MIKVFHEINPSLYVKDVFFSEQLVYSNVCRGVSYSFLESTSLLAGSTHFLLPSLPICVELMTTTICTVVIRCFVEFIWPSCLSVEFKCMKERTSIADRSPY